MVDDDDVSAGLCGGSVVVGLNYDDGDEEYQDTDDGGDVAPGLHAVLPLCGGGGGWLMMMLMRIRDDHDGGDVPAGLHGVLRLCDEDDDL